MLSPADSRFLHVANGTCTTDIIEAAGIPGMRLIWCDPLYEGPVPGGISDADLVDVRRRHLAGSSEDADIAAVDSMIDLREWRRTIAAHESYDELVLWFEHDLFDQLNLIQLLGWIRERLPADKPVTLICIGSFPGYPRFKGLGELSPDDLASLFETRAPVSDAQYDLARRAWQAFREPSPEALEELRRADTSALSFLSAAIARFLQEYPWTSDGLSRSERRLLRLAERGPVGVAAAFPRMHDDENAYYITDRSLASLVDTLSRTSPPLIAVVDNGQINRGALHGEVSLTDAGREVLAGRRDRVECGTDRWLGGVRVQNGAGDLWRWDDERRRMLKR